MATKFFDINNPKPRKKRFRKYVGLLSRIILWFIGLSIIWVLAYKFINPPLTLLMVQRGFERKFDGKDWKIQKKWIPYDSLSRNLKLAAISGEDATFMNHHGFDIKAMQQAYQGNQSGKTFRGGSTISQQTAKNVFLWPGRSYIRKGFEAYFTFLIELFWSKQRILEVYLNVIETGDGIYGMEAASRFYFEKSSSKMTKQRAAMMVAVLPNPRVWKPNEPTRHLYHKQYLILRNMYRLRNLKL